MTNLITTTDRCAAIDHAVTAYEEVKRSATTSITDLGAARDHLRLVFVLGHSPDVWDNVHTLERLALEHGARPSTLHRPFNVH